MSASASSTITTKTTTCVKCGVQKDLKGFGKRQFKSTNLTPTCLECAEVCRWVEWANWFDDPGVLGDGRGPRRACRYCKDLKYESEYSRTEWKSDTPPVCWDCLQTYGALEWALAEIPRADRVLRCHTGEVLGLLLRFQFVTWEEVTTFLASRGDEAYAQKHGFYDGPGGDGAEYSAMNWMMHYACSTTPGDHIIQSLVAGIAREKCLAPGLALRHLTPRCP